MLVIMLIAIAISIIKKTILIIAKYIFVAVNNFSLIKYITFMVQFVSRQYHANSVVIEQQSFIIWGYSIITFAPRGKGVHQNAKVCL